MPKFNRKYMNYKNIIKILLMVSFIFWRFFNENWIILLLFSQKNESFEYMLNHIFFYFGILYLFNAIFA